MRMILGLIQILGVVTSVAALRRHDSDASGLSDITRWKRNDDVGLSALQSVVDQQANTIAQMQSQMTAMQNDIAALRSSLPSTFASVAFSARFSQDPVPMSDHSTLKFDQIITNLGNAYDPHTGIFAAPYAGLYSFYIRFMSTNIGHTYLSIVKHGNLLDEAFANGGTDFDQGSTEVTVHLAIGDQVYVQQVGGASIRGGVYTTFTGHLVQAD